MTMSELRALIPDYGRDIRLSLESVFASDELSTQQTFAVALACAYSLGRAELVEAISGDESAGFDHATREAARAAATIMAMNNVYYRSVHLLGDPEIKAMPVRLRMNVIAKPGVSKVDFELMCFALSALAGCGQCLNAHLHELGKAGISKAAAQAALRIASVLQAAERALRIRDLAG